MKSLNNNEKFKLLNRIGKKKVTENFILISCYTKDLHQDNYPMQKGYCYLGIKTSRKVGNAVLRNKIKRRIRHCIRILGAEFNELRSVACMIIPRKSCASVNFEKLKNTILQSSICKKNVIVN